jgi:hypothetical protein
MQGGAGLRTVRADRATLDEAGPAPAIGGAIAHLTSEPRIPRKARR